MKKIFRILALSLVAVTALVGCKQEESVESDSQPVVKYIRSTDPEQQDVYLTSAAMGQMIALIGEGLEGVCSVKFNDVAAKLNPTYITATSIVVQVPATLPTEITNTITLTTGKGKSCVVENFVSMAPAPLVSSISCEWALPGTEVTISGNYFFDKADGSPIELTIGGQAAELKSVTSTEIVAVVPAGIDTSTKQRVIAMNDNGTGRSSFYLYDKSDVFMDFDDISWDWWGRCTNDLFTEGGIDGQYVKLVGKAAAWNWDENLSLFFCNLLEDGSAPKELIPADDNVGDYNLKFEIKAVAWNDLKMAMWFTDVYNEFSIDGAQAQCHWAGYKAGLPADKWTTVTIPLTDFNTNKEENEDRTLTTAQMKSFCIFFFGNLEDEAQANTPIELWMDNVRLVKKQ